VFDPRGGHWMGGRYIPSLLAAIGEVIEEHLIGIGYIAGPEAVDGPEAEENVMMLEATSGGGADEPARQGNNMQGVRQCPRCGQPSLIRQEGCDTCTSCGHSKCG